MDKLFEVRFSRKWVVESFVLGSIQGAATASVTKKEAWSRDEGPRQLAAGLALLALRDASEPDLRATISAASSEEEARLADRMRDHYYDASGTRGERWQHRVCMKHSEWTNLGKLLSIAGAGERRTIQFAPDVGAADVGFSLAGTSLERSDLEELVGVTLDEMSQKAGASEIHSSLMRDMYAARRLCATEIDALGNRDWFEAKDLLLSCLSAARARPNSWHRLRILYLLARFHYVWHPASVDAEPFTGELVDMARASKDHLDLSLAMLALGQENILVDSTRAVGLIIAAMGSFEAAMKHYGSTAAQLGLTEDPRIRGLGSLSTLNTLYGFELDQNGNSGARSADCIAEGMIAILEELNGTPEKRGGLAFDRFFNEDVEACATECAPGIARRLRNIARTLSDLPHSCDGPTHKDYLRFVST